MNMWFCTLINIINAYPWDTVPLRLQKVKTTEAHLRGTIFLLISKHLTGKEVSKILQQLVTASDSSTHIRIDTANCLVLWTNWNIILENLLLLSSIISIVPILIHTSVSTKMDRSTHFRKGLMMCTYTYLHTHMYTHIWSYLNKLFEHDQHRHHHPVFKKHNPTAPAASSTAVTIALKSRRVLSSAKRPSEEPRKCNSAGVRKAIKTWLWCSGASGKPW